MAALADYGIHMIRRLVESGLGAYEIAFSQVMPTAIAMVPNQFVPPSPCSASRPWACQPLTRVINPSLALQRRRVTPQLC
jgi:hypothetical protein